MRTCYFTGGEECSMKRYMNKKLGIVLKSMAVAVSVMLLLSVSVFAGTVTATGDKETAAVGDTYTVNIVIDGAEGAAVAPDVSVHYDVNRLEFVSCTGEYGGGGGGLVTINSSNADLTFNILSGGQADVDVFATFDGDSEPQIVTATVMVDGEDTAKINENAREDTGTGIEAGTVATADGKYVSSVFADEFMPVGFSKTTVTYEEQMVEAAQFDMGGIVLLYVTDADGNNGNFDMYDQTTGELSDFLQISGIENRFIIALKAGPDVSVPDGFTKATLNWNSQTLEAYAYTGEAGDGGAASGGSDGAASGSDGAVSGGVAPVDINDFFLIYAISSEGNKGWYMYDQNEGTYQRYVQNLHAGGKGNISGSGENLISKITSPGADSEEGGVNVMLIIVIACAVLLVALIVTVIIMAVKLHEFNSYEYIDEDDYEGEDSYEAPATHVVSAYGRAKVSEEEPDDYLTRLAKASEELSRESHDEEKEEEINTQSSKKSDNIEIEEETHESESVESSARSEIPEGFVVRNKAGRIPKEELDMQNRYERDDEYELFSPRDRNEYDDDEDDEDDFRRLSRAEKKALKAEKKARKKEEKRLKKEYGEYGPVDWESWQNGIEGGEKTAAAHINKVAGVDEGAVRREAPIKVSKVEREEMPPSKNLAPKRPVQPEYEEYQPPKDNPMEMMRGIPANDNKAPVQAKPVQQFDFDDDFEFEFLDLDEDDE